MWETKTTDFSAEAYLKCIFLAQWLFTATYVIRIFFFGGHKHKMDKKKTKQKWVCGGFNVENKSFLAAPF